jgi:hypothetical protein
MNRQPRGIRAERSYSHLQLESMALQFRKALGFAEHEPIDGLKFYDQIQDYSVVVDGQNHRIFCRVDRLADGAEAQALFDPDESAYEIILSEQTYDWLELSHPRGKHSLIHECAHVVLHPKLLQQLSLMPMPEKAALYRGGPVPHKFFEDTEWQADALSSAITMPANPIHRLEVERERKRNRLTLAGEMAERFGVSQQAAGYRLNTYESRREQLLAT